MTLKECLAAARAREAGGSEEPVLRLATQLQGAKIKIACKHCCFERFSQ